MRYLLPPTLKIVRSPTKEAEANVAFRSPGLDQSADSMAPAQCQIASVDCGSRSMNSRIRLSVTILIFIYVPIMGTRNQLRTLRSEQLRLLARTAVWPI